MNEPIQDEVISLRQMAIVERYEEFVNYVYPIALNIPRLHTVVKDRFLDAVFLQAELFYQAGKSGQISRLYQADAGLASLRFYLRVMADRTRKLITQHQHQVASVHLAEVGRMLGAWIRDHDGKGAERMAAIGTTRGPRGRATSTTTTPTTATTTSGPGAAVTTNRRGISSRTGYGQPGRPHTGGQPLGPSSENTKRDGDSGE